MNSNKWLKLGAIAGLVAIVGALALSATAFAQGPVNNGAGNGYGAGGRGGWGGPDSSLVAVAAEVLGMDRAALVAELNAGKTIADVAEARGVALEAIVDAFVAPRAEMLAQSVADGRFTQAQADAMLAQMKARVAAQLNAPHAVTPRGNGTGMGTGAAFVDADGDGVCDNLGMRQPRGQRGRGRP